MTNEKLYIYFGSEKNVPNISNIRKCSIKSIADLKIPQNEDAPIWATIVENKEPRIVHTFVVGKVDVATDVTLKPSVYNLCNQKEFLEECEEKTGGLMLVCEVNGKKYVRPFTENDKVFPNKQALAKGINDYVIKLLIESKKDTSKIYSKKNR